MIKITANELRGMGENEGLIIQGCGGDLHEWVDGINSMLTEAEILINNDTFKDVSVFEHDGATNLLFLMDDVKIDVGKLAMWRLQTHSNFGGTWLSDYVPNKLGGFITRQDNDSYNERNTSMLIINAKRNGYAPDQCGNTMTVGEMINFLQDFDEDQKIYLSHDRGYTYGSITERDFEQDSEMDCDEELGGMEVME